MKNRNTLEHLMKSASLCVFCLALPVALKAEKHLPPVDAVTWPSSLSDMGDHWSNLDRASLFKELSIGDTRAANNRIVSAAKEASQEGAEELIYAELITADLFIEHRAVLQRMCQERFHINKLVRPDGLSRDEWNRCLLVRSGLFEHVLGDLASASACCKAILRTSIRNDSEQRELEEASDEWLSPEEANARRKIAQFETQLRRDSRIAK